jgi:hypothetical protein
MWLRCLERKMGRPLDTTNLFELYTRTLQLLIGPSSPSNTSCLLTWLGAAQQLQQVLASTQLLFFLPELTARAAGAGAGVGCAREPASGVEEFSGAAASVLS